jgi:hypothetical protein
MDKAKFEKKRIRELMLKSVSVNLDSIIRGLDECQNKMKAEEGILFARNLGEKLGAKVINNPEGGIIIYIDQNTIHVFQPYPDIDRMYYEY